MEETETNLETDHNKGQELSTVSNQENKFKDVERPKISEGSISDQESNATAPITAAAAASKNVPTPSDSTPSDPEIEEMFQNGIHYGYRRTKRHPKMIPYILGSKNNVEIFDLEKTKLKLHSAIDFLKTEGQKNSVILYVGAKPSIGYLTEKYAKLAESPYFSKRWIGGFITNFSEVKKRIDHFKEVELKKISEDFQKLSKKEQSDFEKEIRRLENNFSGVKEIKSPPQALLIIDAGEELTAVREAKRKNIPVVAIMNTDNNPDDALYPVPANDSAPKSVEYLLAKLTNAYLEGKKEAQNQKPENKS